MTSANNFSLTTDLSTSPYYDDFNADKDFYRILFNPGMAVQARELTQIQTTLQKQIDRLSENIFKEGSIVSGCSYAIDLNTPYIKIKDTDTFSNPIVLQNFLNKEIVGQTSGVKATVFYVAQGSESVPTATKTLFLKYNTSGTDKNTKAFISGESLTCQTDSTTASIISSNTSVGFGSTISINDGIIFAKDHYIRVLKDTLVLDRYSSAPSYRVGFDVNESIVTSQTDSSLNDPASGVSNYAAPGADRLKITTTLTKKGLKESAPNFVELFVLDEGVLKSKIDTPQYSIIKDELARRTFDESGNYTVKGLDIVIKEHLNDGTNNGLYSDVNGGNSQKLVVGVEPGKAYVLGYDIDNLYTRYLDIDKGLDFIDIEQQSIAANYGSYVKVKNVCGYWDVSNHVTVNLYSSAQTKVTSGAYSTSTATGSSIGTARVRGIEYSSGSINADTSEYRLYLYDIKMTTGDFSSVRGIASNSTTVKGFADISEATTVLYETSFDTSVFTLPATAVKRLRDSVGAIDNEFIFYKNFDVSIATNGTFTVSTGASDEVFPYSIGALNDIQIGKDIYVIATSTQTTANLTGTVASTSGSNTITGTSTTFSTQFSIGDQIKIGANVYIISAIASNTSLSISTNALASVSGQSYAKQYTSGQIIDFTKFGSSGPDRTVSIASSTSASFNLQETLSGTMTASVVIKLRKIDGKEKRKLVHKNVYVKINTATHSKGLLGPWGLGTPDVFKISSVRRKNGSDFTTDTDGTDITSEFLFSDGQTDDLYSHSKLIKKPTSTSVITNDYLLVKLDCFEHDTSQGVGYFSVDSYPIDDQHPTASSTITTSSIPIFVSPTTNISYNLRDSIDIRPSVTATASFSTTVAGATVNPAESTTMQTVTGGLHYLPPNTNLVSDLSYYLSRKDIIVLTNKGEYIVIKGISAKLPITPSSPDNGMILAKAEISPYPSLAPNVAATLGRQDLAASATKVKNKRFTMADIGVIDQRVDNLEYYVSLSLLEKDTKDMLILDANGLDRFKNGILVDSFTGHNIGDVANLDYKIAIDSAEGTARPTYKINNVAFNFNSTSSSNVVRKPNDSVLVLSSVTGFIEGETIWQGVSLISATAKAKIRNIATDRIYIEEVEGTFATSTIHGQSSSATATIVSITNVPNGNLVTLPYTHKMFISQPYASTSRNPAGLYYNWKGYMNLTPDMDFWIDTARAPDVQVNYDGNNDNWQSINASWETQWGVWQTVVSGTRTE